MTTLADPQGAGAATAFSHAPTRRRRRRYGRASILTYVVLVVALLLSAFPIYWTFVAASSTNEVIAQTPPQFLPGGNLMDNLRRVFGFEAVDFQVALANSVIVSTCVTVSVLFFSTLAGFAFAKLRFRGRNALLLFVVATMLIPVQLGVIPLYIMMGWVGWTGELQSVIVPLMVSAFGVFFMRQYIVEAMPDELVEAARVDGASTWGIYRRIVFPIIRPAIAVLGLLVFMQTWNDFLWPLVVLNADQPTVQVAISSLAAGYYTDYSLVLAGTALATLPLLLLFVIAGKQLISGIMQGAVKG
jgi:cellobiose transport system permease protein